MEDVAQGEASPGIGLLYKFHAFGVLDYLRAILKVEPLNDFTDVVLDRPFRNTQFGSNLFIG